ncbi:hypothetical protein F5887DRAFT_1077625 [Amanita rubescens]|nr:hypothetical protein F5887DRAFT_1080015 [Amanita rubescens]KAF8338690.1 hypothetical protein F5887DRAFT_1077625 [Amanita rubescens]
MRPVIGPPQTGTYVVELVDDPGKYPTVNNDQSKFSFTNDPRSDAAKWIMKRMGNDVYRVVGKDPSMAPAHDPRKSTVSVSSEGPTEWTIKETDVPGVYSGGPVGHPDLHAYAEINGDQASNDVKHALPLTQTEL